MNRVFAVLIIALWSSCKENTTFQQNTIVDFAKVQNANKGNPVSFSIKNDIMSICDDSIAVILSTSYDGLWSLKDPITILRYRNANTIYIMTLDDRPVKIYYLLSYKKDGKFYSQFKYPKYFYANNDLRNIDCVFYRNQDGSVDYAFVPYNPDYRLFK